MKSPSRLAADYWIVALYLFLVTLAAVLTWD